MIFDFLAFLTMCQLKELSERIKNNYCNLVGQQQHQSDQLKNRKFYENFSEYANFSTFSGKGHKTKDQFL